jgi:hypothetical protein
VAGWCATSSLRCLAHQRQHPRSVPPLVEWSNPTVMLLIMNTSRYTARYAGRTLLLTSWRALPRMCVREKIERTDTRVVSVGTTLCQCPSIFIFAKLPLVLLGVALPLVPLCVKFHIGSFVGATVQLHEEENNFFVMETRHSIAIPAGFSDCQYRHRL